MGLYNMIASFKSQDRNRRSNVLPVTLGSHGSNLDDVILALQSLIPLDEGMPLNINGVKNTVCVFTLCFIGDMPQQQWNSGFKTQRANRGCRCCFIHEKERGNLDYDILNEGRYHQQTVDMRNEMNGRRVADDRTRYGVLWGTAKKPPTLATLTPALDLIVTRPADPLHSEFGGISRMMHEMLVDSILTTKSALEYCNQLRKFPFPPGWGRLQSPLHHLKSYSLSEHARCSIVVPLLLRGWLVEKHVNEHFWNVAVVKTPDVISYIVSCYANCAKSNSVLMALQVSVEDRANLDAIVMKARRGFQSLCTIASRAVVQNSRSQAPTPNERTPRGTAPVSGTNVASFLTPSTGSLPLAAGSLASAGSFSAPAAPKPIAPVVAKRKGKAKDVRTAAELAASRSIQ